MKRTPAREGIAINLVVFIPLTLMLLPFIIIGLPICYGFARLGNANCQYLVHIVGEIVKSHRRPLQRA